MIDPLRVPKRGWDWADARAQFGVHTFEGQLVWWERPDGPSGHLCEAATTQSFDEFLTFGNPVSAPPAVAQELTQILRSAAQPESSTGRIVVPLNSADLVPGRSFVVTPEPGSCVRFSLWLNGSPTGPVGAVVQVLPANFARRSDGTPDPSWRGGYGGVEYSVEGWADVRVPLRFVFAGQAYVLCFGETPDSAVQSAQTRPVLCYHSNMGYSEPLGADGVPIGNNHYPEPKPFPPPPTPPAPNVDQTPMKFTCAVETATLVVFDPQQFADRASDPVDWWCDQKVMVEEISAGRGLFLLLGEDGVYEVSVADKPPTRSQNPVSVLIRVVSGTVYFGAGEDVGGSGPQDDRQRQRNGRFLNYKPGVYRVTAWSTDDERKAVAFHLKPVRAFRRNRVGKKGLWLAE